MKTTKIIDSVGKFLNIPIDDNDQTVGLTISGQFSGMFQILGTVGSDGREIELVAYNPDGTVGDINEQPPLVLFIDVGGYTKVRIIAIQFSSGVCSVTGVTSSAPRIKINASLSGGTGQEVIVTNFPQIQIVTGPLTETQLRRLPIDVIVTNQPVTDTGKDSDGNPLPANFCSYASSFTYQNATNPNYGRLVRTEVRTFGTLTYTRTYNFDEFDNISGYSLWVKS